MHTVLINFKQNSPFHWLKIKITLNAIYEISQIDDKFIKLSDELQQLRKTLNEWLKDGDFTQDQDFIKDGFSPEIDELRKLVYHSDQLLIDYQQKLTQQLQIPVKIKYVNNQWYLIEVSKQKSEDSRLWNQNKLAIKFFRRCLRYWHLCLS